MPHITRKQARQLRKGTPKPIAVKYNPRVSLESLVLRLAKVRRAADEAMFQLCIHIYEQMLTREDVQKAVKAMRPVSDAEAWRIAIRLHRMANDADAMDDLIQGTQPIAYRATMRKAVL